MFVSHGRRLCRDIAVVLFASIAIWIPDIFYCICIVIRNEEAATLESFDSETLRVLYEEGRAILVWSSTSLHV